MHVKCVAIRTPRFLRVFDHFGGINIIGLTGVKKTVMLRKIATLHSTIDTEAVVRRCSVKKVFLKNSQKSLENTCAKAAGLEFY